MNLTAPQWGFRFGLSVAVSLALHGAALWILFRLPSQGASDAERTPLVLDTIAIAPEETATPPGNGASPRLTPVVVMPTLLPPPRSAPATSPRFLPEFVKVGGSGPSVSRSGSESGGMVTAFFQTPTRGQRIVYVLDRSSSMGVNGALEAVKRELLFSLDRLPADACFQIVFYNKHAESLSIDGQSGLLAASAGNKEKVQRKLSDLSAEGGTAHLSALQLALTFDPDVIFFLTDADDLPIEQVRTITRLNRGRAAIHAIELTTANRDRDDMPLHILARDNRGQYRAVALAP